MSPKAIQVFDATTMRVTPEPWALNFLLEAVETMVAPEAAARPTVPAPSWATVHWKPVGRPVGRVRVMALLLFRVMKALASVAARV